MDPRKCLDACCLVKRFLIPPLMLKPTTMVTSALILLLLLVITNALILTELLATECLGVLLISPTTWDMEWIRRDVATTSPPNNECACVAGFVMLSRPSQSQ